MLRHAYKTIKAKLVQAGVTGAGIASENGWSRSYVSHVIAGRSKNSAVRKVIAAKLGCEITDLWSS